MSMVYNHFSLVNAEKRLYKCMYCSYTHIKNFSTTSNMVAHLRSKHPGVFPPMVKRRLLAAAYRNRSGSLAVKAGLASAPHPSSSSSAAAVEPLFGNGVVKQEDVEIFKDVIRPVPSSTGGGGYQHKRMQIIFHDQPPESPNDPPPPSPRPRPFPFSSSPSWNGPSHNDHHHQPPQNLGQQKTTQSSPTVAQSASASSSSRAAPAPTVARLSSPPPFSHPPSTTLAAPATPELEQLHARLLRAQIEKEEAVARYYNALANRANAETVLLRDKL